MPVCQDCVGKLGCPCCGPNRITVVCTCCGEPPLPGQPMIACDSCMGVWYHDKACQKAHEKQHEAVCEDLKAQPELVRAIICSSIESDRVDVEISQETLKALNAMTGNAEFLVDNANNDFKVAFRTGAECIAWCNRMNLVVFPNQQGAVPFLREGFVAKALGPILRFPMEFDHLARYIGEGKIFFDASEGKWNFRNHHKSVGHWEVGYGIEPFQSWIDRQFSKLSASTELLESAELVANEE